MTSYGDLVSDAQKIIYQGKYDDDTNDAVSPFELWNFGIKATPKSGINITHQMHKQASWNAKENKEDISEKNLSKIGMKHDDVQWNLGFGNYKYFVKVGGPLAKDDWKADGDISYTEKQGKSRRIEANLAIESPDMSGANAAVNLGVDQEMKLKGADWTNEKPSITFDACLNVEKDWFVGFGAKHNTEKPEDISGAIMKRDGDNKYWGGYHHSGQFAKVGCLQHYADKNFHHAYEGRWSLKEGATGFQGLPLTIAAGGKYVLSKESTMNYMVELAENAHAIAKWEHKLNKNWKFTATQSLNMKNLKTGEGKEACPAAYQVGFDVNYTL